MGEPHQLMMELQSLTRAPAIFCTFGAQGAALLCGAEFVNEPTLPVQIVDRIGSGDAFAASVLDGWLSDDTSTQDSTALREGLRRGVALGVTVLEFTLTGRGALHVIGL